MESQEGKRRRVQELLQAQVEVKKIVEIVGVSRATVFNVKKKMSKNESLSWVKGSGGHNKKQNQEMINSVSTKIAKDPTTSIRKMAAELEVTPWTVKRVVNEDLGLKSFARPIRHLLTEKMKEKRLERCLKVRNQLKKYRDTVMIYSDKKIFTVDAVLNRRNDRYLAKSTAEVKGIFRTKHPAQVMVLGVVASDGKTMPPFFFPPNQKIGTEEYYKVLRYTVLPWLKASYPEGNYCWTQDGAPSHTARKNQAFCKANMAKFWSKEVWPPSSPDLNPLDFAVWGFLERATNKTSHPSVDALKGVIRREWAKMSSDFIVSSCRSVRRRVQAVIENNGGHIE